MSLRRRTLVTSGAAAIAGPLLPRTSWADVASRTVGNNNEVTITSADIATLKSKMRGAVLQAGDAPYEEVRKNWAGSFDRHPSLILSCKGADDVITAVNFLRNHNLLTAIRAGGHSYSGQSSVERGVMIDLQPMKQLSVDPKARTARAAAGVFLGEFDRACQAHGLATTAGVVPHTGVAGLTLGGGVGRLMRMYGMTIDNVLSMDIVTADGRFLRANKDENPDLFWASLGGAGNFGIVTSFDYQLHKVGPNCNTFAYRFPDDQVRTVMKHYFEYSENAPDNLHTIGIISCGADGKLSAVISATHFGDASEAEKLAAPLAKFGKPTGGDIRTRTYVDVQQGGPNPSPHGRGNYTTGGYMNNRPEIIDPICDRYAASPFAGSSVSFFGLGGQTNRRPNDATAYAHRGALCQVSVGGAWHDPLGKGKEYGDKLIAWSRETWRGLEKYMDGGYYANQTTDQTEQNIRENYRDNYDRLVAMKTKYDPTNFFRLNANIRPKA